MHSRNSNCFLEFSTTHLCDLTAHRGDLTFRQARQFWGFGISVKTRLPIVRRKGEGVKYVLTIDAVQSPKAYIYLIAGQQVGEVDNAWWTIHLVSGLPYPEPSGTDERSGSRGA